MKEIKSWLWSSNHVPPTKYDIKAPMKMDIKGITLHNTQNTVSASKEIDYMLNTDIEVSYHFACDSSNVIQAVPLDRNTWHAGDGYEIPGGNSSTIAIETCYSGDVIPPTSEASTSSSRFKAAEDNAINLSALLLYTFDLGIDDFYFHYNWSNKICPMSTIYDHGNIPYTSSTVTEDQINVALDDVKESLSSLLMYPENIQTPVPPIGSIDITVYRTLNDSTTEYLYLSSNDWSNATVKGLKIILNGTEYLYCDTGDKRITTFKVKVHKSGFEGYYNFYTSDSYRFESYDDPILGIKILKNMREVYDTAPPFDIPWNKGTLFEYISGPLNIAEHNKNNIFELELKDGAKETFFISDRNRFAAIEANKGQWYEIEFNPNSEDYPEPLLIFQNVIGIYAANDLSMIGYATGTSFMGKKSDPNVYDVYEIQYFMNTEYGTNYTAGLFKADMNNLCIYHEDGNYWESIEYIYDIEDVNQHWPIGSKFTYLNTPGNDGANNQANGNGGGLFMQYTATPDPGAVVAVAKSIVDSHGGYFTEHNPNDPSGIENPNRYLSVFAPNDIKTMDGVYWNSGTTLEYRSIYAPKLFFAPDWSTSNNNTTKDSND